MSNTNLNFLLLIIQICVKIISTRDVIVVAGNFSLNGKLVNLAEYDIAEGT